MVDDETDGDGEDINTSGGGDEEEEENGAGNGCEVESIASLVNSSSGAAASAILESFVIEYFMKETWGRSRSSHRLSHKSRRLSVL